MSPHKPKRRKPVKFSKPIPGLRVGRRAAEALRRILRREAS